MTEIARQVSPSRQAHVETINKLYRYSYIATAISVISSYMEIMLDNHMDFFLQFLL